MQNHRLLIIGLVGILTCCVVAGSASAFENLFGGWGLGHSGCCGSSCCNTGCSDCCDVGCGSCCDTGCESCCDMGCGCGCGCGSSWLFYADALLLHRDSNYPSGNGKCHKDNFDEEEGFDLDSKNHDFDSVGIGASNGWQIGAIKKLNCRWDMEVRFQMFDGDSNKYFEETGTFGPRDRWEWGASAWQEYVSSVYSTEINLGLTHNCWLRPLIGFRWIELEERYNQGNDGWIDIIIPVGAGFGQQVKTNNHLYGFQLGADAVLLNHRKFSILAGMRAGIYGNYCQQRSQFCVWGNIGEIEEKICWSESADTNNTAFQGELTLLAEYTINCHWAIRGGYYLYWLEGVAQAPNQLDGSNDNGPRDGGCKDVVVVTDGSPFYQGVMVGLEASW